MKAIILAAGMGERLGELTKSRPKCLLELSDGMTVLDNQLSNIKQSSIDEVVIVTGHCSEQVETYVKSYSDDLKISCLYNPFYKTHNNMFSLWLALRSIKGEVVVINGDDVFHHSILDDLLLRPGSEKAVMVMNRKDNYTEEDMKIVTKDYQVELVSKKIPLNEANGESIGMIRFIDEGRETLEDILEELVRDEENNNVFWLQAVQVMIDRKNTVHYSECDATKWAEIDFHPDLTMIQQHLSRFTQSIGNWN